jgi:hypothetical protein
MSPDEPQRGGCVGGGLRCPPRRTEELHEHAAGMRNRPDGVVIRRRPDPYLEVVQALEQPHSAPVVMAECVVVVDAEHDAVGALRGRRYDMSTAVAISASSGRNLRRSVPLLEQPNRQAGRVHKTRES